jgi:hypothetical protein
MWLDTVDRFLRVRKLGLTIITRWKQSNLLLMFETWHLITEESKRQRIRLDRKYRLIQRWANAAMVGALDTWEWATARHNKQRQSATKILARWQHSCVFGAFTGWLENVNAAQQDRVFFSRAVRLWFNMTLSKCLHAWIGQAVDTKRQDYLRTRSVQTWTKHLRFRAFSCFKERVSSAVRQRALMARIARRWMQAAIIGAWSTWIDVTIRSMQIKVITHRVIQRWRLHSLLGALNIWRFVTHERHSTILRLLKTKLTRLKNRLSFSVMNSWRENALLQRRLRWLKRKAKKGIGGWMNTERAVIFDHWRDHVMQHSSLTKLAVRLVLRWRSKTLEQAFLKWVDNLQWMAKSKRVLARSLTRWFDHVLDSVGNTWVLNTQKRRKKYHALVHSLQVWQRSSVGRAWNQWKSQHDINAHFCTVGGRITRRMLHYKLSQGFYTWQGRIAAVKQVSAIMRRVIRRLSFHTLLRVWDLWNDYVLQSQQARREAVAQHDRDDQKKEENVTRLLCKGRGMPKLKAFNAWHHLHNLMMHFKRILRRMHNVQLASALTRFYEIVARLKRHKYDLEKCHSVWLNRSSTHAFQKWQTVHQHSRKIHYFVSQAARRIYWHTYERYYDHWRESAMHLKAARGRMVRHLRLSIHRQLKAAVFTWAANIMQMIRVKMTVLRQQQEFQDKERRLHTIAMKIFHRGLCRLLHFAFLRWHAVTVETRKFLAAGRKIVMRGQQAARGKMLKRWVAAVNVQQQARRRWHSLLAMRSLVALQVHTYVLVVIVGACTIVIFDVMQLYSLLLSLQVLIS